MKMNKRKKALVLGGGGFIGGHLSKRLKEEGFWVRVVDIKRKHEFWSHYDICDEYICGDLGDDKVVSSVLLAPNQKSLDDKRNSFDEVYQLAADMGGAGYIFSGENDADVMHNSSLINLNVVKHAVEKRIKRIFYSSSACMYPEHNQLDPNNPNCTENSAYPADPDSEYGWEKLFSERLYLAFNRNYGLDVRIARFHNIFGPQGTWKGGKEKAPAAMCRKVSEVKDGGEIEVWGDGKQTRSFLYIDDCLEAILRFVRQNNFLGPVNIGSEEMITINDFAQMVINISGKDVRIKNIDVPQIGVRGRNSDNRLYRKHMNWEVSKPLIEGVKETFKWINSEVENEKNKF
tara:strand:- start:811 stop:1848 length:1038 start_codon:yes stop_codon:yes gene_type:complete